MASIAQSFQGLKLATILISGALVAAASEDENPRTIIESNSLELATDAKENRFLFSGDVRIRSTNLEAECDRMTVVSLRTPDSDPEATLAEIGSIASIYAEGNVVIRQAGRTATAGRAEIYPGEGRVVLTEDPVVRDERGMTVTGPRMVILQGERRVLIEGVDGALTEARPTVSLPSLPDLGFDADPEPTESTGEGGTP